MGLTRTQRAERMAAKQAAEARREAVLLEGRTAIQLNKCPRCGRPVRRNLALTGWVQCSQYGADGFRADSSQPECEWKGFYA